MILVACSPGHVGEAVHEAARALHEPIKEASADDTDLFMTALGCRAIVYVPEPRLIDADSVHAQPERMRRIVSAAQAPGVERVIVITPLSKAWDEEHVVLKKNGVGYTILRTGPLVDEVADATNLHTARAVWLPRGTTVR